MEKLGNELTPSEASKKLRQYLKNNEKDISFFDGTRGTEIDEKETDPKKLLSAINKRYLIKNISDTEQLIEVLMNPKKTYKELNERIKNPFLEKEEKKVRNAIEKIGRLAIRAQRQLEDNFNNPNPQEKTEKEWMKEKIVQRLTTLSKLEPLDRLNRYMDEIKGKSKEDIGIRYLDNNEDMRQKIVRELQSLRRRIFVYYSRYKRSEEILGEKSQELKEIKQSFEERKKAIQKFEKIFKEKIITNADIENLGGNIDQEREMLDTLYPQEAKETTIQTYMPYPGREEEGKNNDLPDSKMIPRENLDEWISYILMDDATTKSIFDVVYGSKKKEINDFKKKFMETTHREYMKESVMNEEVQKKAKKMQSFMIYANKHSTKVTDEERRKLEDKFRNRKALDTIFINLRESIAIELINHMVKSLIDGGQLPAGLEIIKSGTAKDLKGIDCELLYKGKVIKSFDMKITNDFRTQLHNDYGNNEKQRKYRQKTDLLRIPKDFTYQFMNEYISNIILGSQEDGFNQEASGRKMTAILSKIIEMNRYTYDELEEEIKEECYKAETIKKVQQDILLTFGK